MSKRLELGCGGEKKERPEGAEKQSPSSEEKREEGAGPRSATYAVIVRIQGERDVGRLVKRGTEIKEGDQDGDRMRLLHPHMGQTAITSFGYKEGKRAPCRGLRG